MILWDLDSELEDGSLQKCSFDGPKIQRLVPRCGNPAAQLHDLSHNLHLSGRHNKTAVQLSDLGAITPTERIMSSDNYADSSDQPASANYQLLLQLSGWCIGSRPWRMANLPLQCRTRGGWCSAYHHHADPAAVEGLVFLLDLLNTQQVHGRKKHNYGGGSWNGDIT